MPGGAPWVAALVAAGRVDVLARVGDFADVEAAAAEVVGGRADVVGGIAEVVRDVGVGGLLGAFDAAE